MPKLPEFSSEEEFADFVDTHDMSEYWDEMEEVDTSQIRFVRPKPASVNVPLSRSTLEQLKAAAKKQHQSVDALLQQWVMERLEQEQTQEPAKELIPA